AEKAAEEKAAAKKAAADKKAKEAAAEKAKEEAAKEAKETAAKEAAKEAAAEKAAADKKAKADAAKKAAAEKAANAKRDALKSAMRGDALEAAGIPGGTADRNQSGGGGNDNGYAAKVRACVRPRVAYPVPPRAQSNPTVQYRANLDAQGLVTSVQVQRSSGITAFDRAVATGIRSCSPFPKPPSGKYPSYVDGDYRMYD
ncbi:MAG: cell envelope integrity protein TolA, partial [Burkholderiaceae bacterium]